nr:PREDICTED: beta-1,4-glucuronyltransferase 1-like [Bemisia tabaci]
MAQIKLYQIRLSRLKCFAVMLGVITLLVLLQLSALCKLVWFRGTLFCWLRGVDPPPRRDAGLRPPRPAKFRPGAFLRNRTADDHPHCRFRYDLSSSTTPELNVSLSPELGDRYRVVYNVIESDAAWGDGDRVTLCSHVTPEFAAHVAELVTRWEGPLSIAAFVPDRDAADLVCAFRTLCRCLEDMSRVSLHLVFPKDAPPKFAPCGRRDGCLLRRQGLTFRARNKMTYPVNVARNAARFGAFTRFILVSDVELYPSGGLESGFVRWITKLGSWELGRVAFVVPVFEVDERSPVPGTKSRLLALHQEERAVYFHKWICAHCQKFPGIEKWLKRPDAGYGVVQALLISKREYPFHRWEPIFIGTHADPLYSESLTWEGRQDKMTQMHLMCLMSYRFVILDGAFLTHSPGIKRKFESGIERRLKLQYEHQNYLQYNRIVKDASKEYGVNEKCRIH